MAYSSQIPTTENFNKNINDCGVIFSNSQIANINTGDISSYIGGVRVFLPQVNPVIAVTASNNDVDGRVGGNGVFGHSNSSRALAATTTQVPGDILTSLGLSSVNTACPLATLRRSLTSRFQEE